MMLMMIEWVGIFQGDANTVENSDDARNILETAKVQNLKLKDISCLKILKLKVKEESVKGGHLGQRAQPAVHAVLVKQHARLVKLRIPPIFLLHHHLSPTFLLVQTPQYPLLFYAAHSDLSLLLYAVVATGLALSGQALRRTALQPTTVS